jgi:hypothetical protein
MLEYSNNRILKYNPKYNSKSYSDNSQNIRPNPLVSISPILTFLLNHGIHRPTPAPYESSNSTLSFTAIASTKSSTNSARPTPTTAATTSRNTPGN